MRSEATLRDELSRTGAFTVRVVPSAEWLAIRTRPHQALPWHESVLRPLVEAAETAHVYRLDEDPDILSIARPILRRERHKYAIDLGSDPIVGYELLWNASGGKRGSIVLTMPAARFPGRRIFPHCQDAFVVTNPTVAHTPGAIRFARAAVADGRTLCCLLSRTNGFEFMSVHATPAQLEALLIEARSLVVHRAWYAPVP